MIRENHDPVYADQPGLKRTCELLPLSSLGPGMRKSVDFVKEFDSCQRRKRHHEFNAPLGNIGNPVAPFEIISMDITGSYPATARKNKYLLTIVDHFFKYAEIFPIPDQSAPPCGQIYALQIVTRHGSGWKLITDQGAAFMSSFFKETCKVMGIRRSHTSSYHAMSNGLVER